MIYVYAFITGRSGGPAVEGLAGEPVRFLELGDVGVAAQDLAQEPQPEIDALRRHDAAVRALAGQAAAILPARFGSVCATEEELARWVERRHDPLAAALRLVQGCDQMTVRAYAPGGTCRPAPTTAAVDSEATSPHAEATASPLALDRPAAGPGTRYLAGKLRSEPAEFPAVFSLRRALEPMVRAERVSTHEAPPLLATLHHLVCRSAADEYARALQDAAAAVAPVRVVATGPWAPYAFAPEELT